ncbi:unnamed protein product, partial [Phaeothamnion confervicola]
NHHHKGSSRGSDAPRRCRSALRAGQDWRGLHAQCSGGGERNQSSPGRERDSSSRRALGRKRPRATAGTPPQRRPTSSGGGSGGEEVARQQQRWLMAPARHDGDRGPPRVASATVQPPRQAPPPPPPLSMAEDILAADVMEGGHDLPKCLYTETLGTTAVFVRVGLKVCASDRWVGRSAAAAAEAGGSGGGGGGGRGVDGMGSGGDGSGSGDDGGGGMAAAGADVATLVVRGLVRQIEECELKYTTDCTDSDDDSAGLEDGVMPALSACRLMAVITAHLNALGGAGSTMLGGNAVLATATALHEHLSLALQRLLHGEARSLVAAARHAAAAAADNAAAAAAAAAVLDMRAALYCHSLKWLVSLAALGVPVALEAHARGLVEELIACRGLWRGGGGGDGSAAAASLTGSMFRLGRHDSRGGGGGSSGSSGRRESCSWLPPCMTALWFVAVGTLDGGWGAAAAPQPPVRLDVGGVQLQGFGAVLTAVAVAPVAPAVPAAPLAAAAAAGAAGEDGRTSEHGVIRLTAEDMWALLLDVERLYVFSSGACGGGPSEGASASYWHCASLMLRASPFRTEFRAQATASTSGGAVGGGPTPKAQKLAALRGIDPLAYARVLLERVLAMSQLWRMNAVLMERLWRGAVRLCCAAPGLATNGATAAHEGQEMAAAASATQAAAAAAANSAAGAAVATGAARAVNAALRQAPDEPRDGLLAAVVSGFCLPCHRVSRLPDRVLAAAPRQKWAPWPAGTADDDAVCALVAEVAVAQALLLPSGVPRKRFINHIKPAGDDGAGSAGEPRA